ncbi:hypothetical protein FJZ28_00225 [Candidatus Peregrinibacteria bacterium]|nr:hypothetical protein [Candidatus Peregrinibacteria bacterium]
MAPGNLEIPHEGVNEAVKDKVNITEKAGADLDNLSKKVTQREKRSEITENKKFRPEAKELVVNATKEAIAEHMTLSQMTDLIQEKAKNMSKDIKDQVIELTAKVTVRQGMPSFEQPALLGEGQIEAV